MDRRSFLRGLALGGVAVAGELWIPGQKLISIPKSVGQSYAEALGRSLYTTKANVAARVFSSVDFRELIAPQLNRIFTEIYSADKTNKTFGEDGADVPRWPLQTL
jgi:hypothetical protein